MLNKLYLIFFFFLLNLVKTELLFLYRGHTRNLPTENSYNIEGIEFNAKILKEKELIKFFGITVHKNIN